MRRSILTIHQFEQCACIELTASRLLHLLAWTFVLVLASLWRIGEMHQHIAITKIIEHLLPLVALNLPIAIINIILMK